MIQIKYFSKALKEKVYNNFLQALEYKKGKVFSQLIYLNFFLIK